MTFLSFSNTFLHWCACRGLTSTHCLLMCLLTHWMTFKWSTSSSIDALAFKHVTSSFVDTLTFQCVTSPYVHVPTTFMCLPANTSSFKHWTSPFEKPLMALKQTKKIRDRNGYVLLPLQTLKPILSSHWCIFKFHPMFFSLVNSSPCVFDYALCFGQTQGTHPSCFGLYI